MNQELNEKIEAIHSKYEKQREMLLSKRSNNIMEMMKQEYPSEAK